MRKPFSPPPLLFSRRSFLWVTIVKRGKARGIFLEVHAIPTVWVSDPLRGHTFRFLSPFLTWETFLEDSIPSGRSSCGEGGSVNHVSAHLCIPLSCRYIVQW